MSIYILVLGRLRQEDRGFQVCLGCIKGKGQSQSTEEIELSGRMLAQHVPNPKFKPCTESNNNTDPRK